MTVQWITMRGYISGSENMMLQGLPTDRQKTRFKYSK